jgi:hypothetical protein
MGAQKVREQAATLPESGWIATFSKPRFPTRT